MVSNAVLLLVLVALIPLGTCDISSWRNRLKLATRALPQHETGLGSAGAASGVSGWVEMDAKLDMRQIVGLLVDLPDIKRLLTNLTDKVETFDKEMILAAIIPQLSGLKDSLGLEFDEINKIIKNLFQNLHNGPLGSTEKNILQILDFLKNHNQKPVQCNMTDVELGLENVLERFHDELTEILQIEKREMAKEEEGIEAIHGNTELLLKILSVLDMEKKTPKGFGTSSDCPMCKILKDIYNKEIENFKIIESVGTLVHDIPNEIGVVIKTEVGVGVIKQDIQKLLKIDQSIKEGVDKLIHLVEVLTERSVKYFSASQKITIETHASLQESLETVQKSAASTEEAVKSLVTSRGLLNAARLGCKGKD